MGGVEKDVVLIGSNPNALAKRWMGIFFRIMAKGDRNWNIHPPTSLRSRKEENYEMTHGQEREGVIKLLEIAPNYQTTEANTAHNANTRSTSIQESTNPIHATKTDSVA